MLNFLVDLVQLTENLLGELGDRFLFLSFCHGENEMIGVNKVCIQLVRVRISAVTMV